MNDNILGQIIFGAVMVINFIGVNGYLWEKYFNFKMTPMDTATISLIALVGLFVCKG